MGCFLSCCFNVGINPGDPSVSAYARTTQYESQGDTGYIYFVSPVSPRDVYVREGMLYFDAGICCIGSRGYPISNISSVEVIRGESVVVGGQIMIPEPQVKITGSNNTRIVFSTPNAEHFVGALEAVRHSESVKM